MKYCERLSSEINTPYTNITLDVGAATNAFKYLWSNNKFFKCCNSSWGLSFHEIEFYGKDFSGLF